MRNGGDKERKGDENENENVENGFIVMPICENRQKIGKRIRKNVGRKKKRINKKDNIPHQIYDKIIRLQNSMHLEPLKTPSIWPSK